MTKSVTKVKINMPTFVKRVRRTYQNKRNIIAADGAYLEDGKVDIIGAGLSKEQLKVVSRNTLNSQSITSLVKQGIVQVDKRYVERLGNLQAAHDNGDKEAVRLRLRHLEASVKKNYPAAFRK